MESILSITVPTRTAETSVPILGVLAGRWSPRSFDNTADVTERQLTAALEAARWSPSSSNSQPWRFIVTRRGTPEHATIVENLTGLNPVWAGFAPVLIVTVAVAVDDAGRTVRFAEYDLGQSVAHLSVQAHHDGLHVHQMGGIVADGLKAAFGLSDTMRPVSVVAVGVLGEPEGLATEVLREREVQPRRRRPLSELLISAPEPAL
jgi:nitroreductase